MLQLLFPAGHFCAVSPPSTLVRKASPWQVKELRRVPGWSCQDLGLALRSFCPGWDSLSDPLRMPAFWVSIVLEQIHRSKEPGSREILSLCQKPNILLKGRKN